MQTENKSSDADHMGQLSLLTYSIKVFLDEKLYKDYDFITFADRLKSALLEKPSVTQDHNTRVTENSVTHIDREAQSLVLTDFSDRSTWMMEFSVTLVFWSSAFLTVCLTLIMFA
jgi:hypothetical protein